MALVLILFVLARIFSRAKGKGRAKTRPDEDDFLARVFIPIPIEEREEST